MRVKRGVISYSPRCLSLSVCGVATIIIKWQLVYLLNYGIISILAAWQRQTLWDKKVTR